jgi:copper transport protein
MMFNYNKTKLFTIMIIIVILSVITVPNIPSSHAHAFITKSDPLPSQSLSTPPTKVDIYFSDPVDIKYSQLKILDSDGKQIQVGDQQYINEDQSTLSIALPQDLKNGIYTVSTKVLDQTDGHVTENAFVFGVGQEVPQNIKSTIGANNQQEVSIPEAVARFPALVGQVLVAGSVASTLWLWGPINRIPRLRDALSKTRFEIEHSMTRLTVIGSIIILASGFAMIIVQAYSINAGILDAISTKFGNMWILRMIASSALFALSIWIYLKTKKSSTLLSKAHLAVLTGTSFTVLLSTSLISHGAATGKIVPLLLDFTHNVFASLWIGGIIYIAFVVMPHLKKITSNPNLSMSAIALLIPRFSTLVITILGAVTITGPFLLYAIEGNFALTLASFYGKILIIKLSLAAAMIAFGAYDHIFISNKAYFTITDKASRNNLSQSINLDAKSILDKFNTSIKIEAIVGIALIASVAVLVDSGLPSSEFQNQIQSISNKVFALTTNMIPISQEFTQTRFVENGSRTVLTISPFSTGSNYFSISFLDSNKKPIDMKSVQIKLTQTESGIGPITIDANKTSDGKFTTDTDFGFPGHWTVRVEGVQNKENSLNLVSSYNLFVKPKLDNVQSDIKEYKTPGNNSAPRYPVYDSARNKVWVGDTSRNSGKILDFDLGTNKFTEHKIDGLYGVIYSALDSHNTLWYIDYQRKVLGNYNPDNNSNKDYPIPNQGILTSMAIDNNDTVWITSNTNDLLKFDTRIGKFNSIKLHDKSDPLGISIDNSQNKIWIAEGIGKISSVDMSDNKVIEFTPKGNYTMNDPTGIIIDSQTGKIYISEHSGNAVSVFDPLLKTFKKIQLDPDKDNLPYGMAFDKYHNLWIAQHTIDKISVVDTSTGQVIEKNIPSSNTWTQWITADSQGDIIIAEERANALGIVTISAGQSINNQQGTTSAIPKFDFDYAQIVAPSITGLLVIVGFFYSKGVVDTRRASEQIKRHQEF